MLLASLGRFLVFLFALSFAALGLEFWASPADAAGRLGLAAIDASGRIALRADLGGLFIGLSALCGAAAWTRRRPWILSAVAVLAAIVIGRSIGWFAGGGGDNPTALAIELGAIAALAMEFASAALATQLPSAALVNGASRPSEAGEPHRWRRRMLFAAGGVAAIVTAAIATVVLNADVQQQIFDRAAEQMTASVNSAPLEDDALRIAVCGSSAPLPSASRAKACVAVFAGGKFYVVDAGPESTENLVLWTVPLSKIGGVLLTHFHSDHIGDLGELQLQTWAGGRTAPLPVYGGPGIERVVGGFNEAYRLDQGYRTGHHGEKVMPSAAWGMVARTIEPDGAPSAAKNRTGLVFDDGSLRITAIEVDHAPIEPAYAYRFDYKGRSAVITGDLKFHAPLVAAAKDADVLISEAIAVSMTRALQKAARGAGRDKTAAIMHDIEDYHITPEEAARVANDAGVRLLVYYHLLPAPDGFLPQRLFAQGVNDVRRGDWTIADDGSMYTLPIGSKEVRIGRVTE